MLFVLQTWFLVVAMTKITREHIRQLARLMRDERDQGRPFAFLTGAGCSKPAGIPTAPEIVAELCARPLGENIRHQIGNQAPTGKDYGAVMGALTVRQRKDYFTEILKDTKINFGHIALASMMKAGYVGRVLTFNFDSILVRAASMLGLFPAVYDFGVSPATKFDHIAEKSVLHLHGQGFGQVMKNTGDQTTTHAKALRLLFDNTLQKSGLIVAGYSGEADAAFPELKSSACANDENHLYWCNFDDQSAPPHIAEMMNTRTESKTYLQDVNFDIFAVQLAQELECFELDLLHKPAAHLLDILKPIVPPPEDLPGVQKTLNDVRTKLQKWSDEDIPKASDLLNDALMEGDWKKAIALHEENYFKAESEKQSVAWAYTMRGNELLDSAKLQNDEVLFRESFAKYAAALKLKPNLHEALNNWGNALQELAKIKTDEALFRDSFVKYEAALEFKPDKEEALYNWGLALQILAKIKNDEDLFRNSFEKFEAALRIKPDFHEALIIWGNALSDLAEIRNDKNMFQESFAKYEAALKIKPEDHGALNNWGTALQVLAKIKADEQLYSEAFEKFDAALKINPDFHTALGNWGNALLGLAQLKNDETIFRECFRKYDAALKINPEDHGALNNWGTALKALAKIKNDENLFRESFEKYEAALNIKPDKHQALENWGAALLELFDINVTSQKSRKIVNTSRAVFKKTIL
jgi:tetratricopeptide (TPR) repeat protein